MEAQDWNRFFVVETVTREKSGQTHEDFALISEAAEMLKKYKNLIFARCYNRIPQILKNQKIVHDYLKHNRSFRLQRTSLQLSVLIACFYEYIGEFDINNDEIEQIMRDYNLDKSDYVEYSKTDQAESCLSALMSMEIDPYTQRTLSFCIQTLIEKSTDYNDTSHEYVRMLGSHGIRILSHDTIFIHVNSRKIKNKIKEFSDYANILRRNELICIKKNDTQIIPAYENKVVRGIRIKIS
jgi:hypothetical protein